MKTRLVSLVLIATAVLMFTGCSKIGEPWDPRDTYEEERARSPEQQKDLRHRIRIGQIER